LPEFIFSCVCNVIMCVIIHIYGCHCVCSPCIILTHKNSCGGEGEGRKKQTGSINVITINCELDEGKKCNRRKTRVIYTCGYIYTHILLYTNTTRNIYQCSCTRVNFKSFPYRSPHVMVIQRPYWTYIYRYLHPKS